MKSLSLHLAEQAPPPLEVHLDDPSEVSTVETTPLSISSSTSELSFVADNNSVGSAPTAVQPQVEKQWFKGLEDRFQNFCLDQIREEEAAIPVIKKSVRFSEPKIQTVIPSNARPLSPAECDRYWYGRPELQRLGFNAERAATRLSQPTRECVIEAYLACSAKEGLKLQSKKKTASTKKRPIPIVDTMQQYRGPLSQAYERSDENLAGIEPYVIQAATSSGKCRFVLDHFDFCLSRSASIAPKSDAARALLASISKCISQPAQRWAQEMAWAQARALGDDSPQER